MAHEEEPLLLISGAGLPPWIWDGPRQQLASKHETEVARRPYGDSATLADYATTALESAPWERFTIIAHSAGGLVGAEALRRAPARVGGILAVSAVVPRPGGSFVSAMPFSNRIVLSLAMKLAGTRPPDSAIRRGLTSGLDDETADRIVADFQPESARYYRDRTGAAPIAQRRGYIFTDNDKEIPLALQRRFAVNLGAPWRGRLETGHLPMLEAPAKLARAVDAFLAAAPD